MEPQYTRARIDGDVVTLDFVKKMMDDFKNKKCLHKRYACYVEKLVIFFICYDDIIICDFVLVGMPSRLFYKRGKS